MNLNVFAGTATGPAHKKKGLPCDDTGKADMAEGFGILVCSDGAGSALQSRYGSKIIVETFEAGLKALANKVSLIGPGEWIVDEVVELSIKARRAIKTQHPKNPFSDFHSTLVACLAGTNGGFLVHIGDGLGCVVTEEDGKYDLIISGPENGEYANETFFITESNWIKHLRVTPFAGNLVFAATMTDGAHSLFQSKGALDISALVELSLTLEDGSTEIGLYLDSEKAQSTSSDDKTLCLLTSKHARQYLSSLLRQQTGCEDAGDLTANIKPKTQRIDTDELNQRNKKSSTIFKEITQRNYRLQIVSVLILIIIALLVGTAYLFLSYFFSASSDSRFDDHQKESNQSSNKNEKGRIKSLSGVTQDSNKNTESSESLSSDSKNASINLKGKLPALNSQVQQNGQQSADDKPGTTRNPVDDKELKFIQPKQETSTR